MKINWIFQMASKTVYDDRHAFKHNVMNKQIVSISQCFQPEPVKHQAYPIIV